MATNEEINSWQVCDPELIEDPLPQPYRRIDEILHETILKQLYLRVHEIQNKKKDPNYEGSIKQLQSQGTLEVDGISFVAKDPIVSTGHIVVGDRAGSVYVIDVSKKMVLSKKEIVAGRRVEHIAVCTYVDGEVAVTTIAVILRGEPSMYILRFRSGEYKLFLQHVLRVSKVKAVDASTDISTYPLQSTFSDYGMYLAVSTYNGDVLVFQVPEVSLLRPKEQQGVTSSKGLSPQTVTSVIHPTYYAQLDEPLKTIEEPVARIAFSGLQPPVSYTSLLASMKKKEEVIVESVPDPKATKKEAKKQQPIKQEPKSRPKLTNASVLYGEIIQENLKDYSPPYPVPVYKPSVYFLSTPCKVPRSKYFESVKNIQISTNILIAYRHSKSFCIYQFIQNSPQSLPGFIYEQLYHETKTSKKPDPKVIKLKELHNIYTITCTALSPDQSLLACGLKDGTISLWDLQTDSVRCNLDKHQHAVSCMAFFEIYRLVSGSVSGEVFMHDLVTFAPCMKRTNIFESKVDFCISTIQVSMIGLAYVFDTLGNLRLYDLWRGQKIARMQAASSFPSSDGKTKRWFSERPLLVVDEGKPITSDPEITS